VRPAAASGGGRWQRLGDGGGRVEVPKPSVAPALNRAREKAATATAVGVDGWRLTSHEGWLPVA